MAHPHAFLPHEAVLRLMVVLERSLDLDEFTAGGVNVWPLVRLALCTMLLDPDAIPRQLATPDPTVAKAVACIAAAYRDVLGGAPTIPSADRQASAFAPALHGTPRASGNGMLFLTRPEEHYLQTEGQFVAPILDNWYSLARDLGPAWKVEWQYGGLSPRLPRRFPCIETIHSLPDARSTDPLLLAALSKAAETACRHAAAVLRPLLPSVPEAESMVAANLAIVLATRRRFKALLDEMQPGCVFLNCWYHPAAIGFLWAAWENGCQRVEVQHGVNGTHHMGYTHWSHIPVQAAPLMPDTFLTWGTGSANNIARWIAPSGHVPNIVIGGRLLGEGGTGRNQSLPAALQKRLDQADRVILVSLQPTPETGLTENLLETMRKAPSGWLWLVRCHPLADLVPGHPPALERINARLIEHGLTNAECSQATAAPLGALLARADHHITHFSSVTLEALGQGVPTTLISRAAAGYFDDLIGAGLTAIAQTPDDILRSISQSSEWFDPARGQEEVLHDVNQARSVLQSFKCEPV